MKNLMSVVVKNLKEHGFLEGVHDNCTMCESDPDCCDVLKCCVQNMMNLGMVQFSKSRVVEEISFIEPITIVYRKKKVETPPKRIQPIHICVSGPLPFQDTKAVPWRYDTTTYVGGREIQFSEVEIVNIDGMGGMTHIGRVFAPKYTPRVSASPTIFPYKEKVIPVPPPHTWGSIPATQVVTTIPAVTKVILDKVAKSETSKGKGMMNEDE